MEPHAWDREGRDQHHHRIFEAAAVREGERGFGDSSSRTLTPAFRYADTRLATSSCRSGDGSKTVMGGSYLREATLPGGKATVT